MISLRTCNASMARAGPEWLQGQRVRATQREGMCACMRTHTLRRIPPTKMHVRFYIHKHKLLSTSTFMDRRHLCVCVSACEQMCPCEWISMSAACEPEAWVLWTRHVDVSLRICKQNAVALSTSSLLPHKINIPSEP